MKKLGIKPKPYIGIKGLASLGLIDLDEYTLLQAELKSAAKNLNKYEKCPLSDIQKRLIDYAGYDRHSNF